MKNPSNSGKPRLDLFDRARDLRRLLAIALVITVLVNAAVTWHLATKIGSKPQILLMDEATFYLPKSLDFAEAKELHVEQAELAMESLFDRGPAGIDHPERLKRLCEKGAFEDAESRIRADDAVFASKKLHQKFELQSVQLLQAGDGAVLTAVEGQLLRTGSFDGGAFHEALRVNARIHFVRNPAMIANGAFPTLIRSIKFQTTPISSR